MKEKRIRLRHSRTRKNKNILNSKVPVSERIGYRDFLIDGSDIMARSNQAMMRDRMHPTDILIDIKLKNV